MTTLKKIKKQKERKSVFGAIYLIYFYDHKWQKLITENTKVILSSLKINNKHWRVNPTNTILSHHPFLYNHRLHPSFSHLTTHHSL